MHHNIIVDVVVVVDRIKGVYVFVIVAQMFHLVLLIIHFISLIYIFDYS